MDITILGIESSCDDTSAAVLRNNVLLSNVIASQAVHVKYGGVIPELASRAHQQNIVPVVDTALREAGVGIGDVVPGMDDHTVPTQRRRRFPAYNDTAGAPFSDGTPVDPGGVLKVPALFRICSALPRQFAAPFTVSV